MSLLLMTQTIMGLVLICVSGGIQLELRMLNLGKSLQLREPESVNSIMENHSIFLKTPKWRSTLLETSALSYNCSIKEMEEVSLNFDQSLRPRESLEKVGPPEEAPVTIMS